MHICDVLVIGAGILGCFTARALTRYQLDVVVLEAREDVCTGISKSNTAIVYSGYHTRPGTLKTRLCVEECLGFSDLCKTLSVPFRRCGSLMVCFGSKGEAVLRQKLAQGQENGVEGLTLLTGAQVLDMEPSLNGQVRLGLYAPATGTVNPWALCFAAYENACENGAVFHMNNPVTAIEKSGDVYLVTTPAASFHARRVINCAGLFADRVRELLYPPSLRIVPAKAEYLVLDDTAGGAVNRVIFHEPERKQKGLTLVPTVDGNLLVGPTEGPAAGKEDFATTREGLEGLRALVKEIAPGIDLTQTIRSFASLRPHAYQVEWPADGSLGLSNKSISGFTILEEEGLISLIGIKTPGLTCARGLGQLAAEKAAASLGATKINPYFSPSRKEIPRLSRLPLCEQAALAAENPAYGDVVCRCKTISEGEIRTAIHRGAVTLDGVKRRTGAGCGRCQGGYCTERILHLLSDITGRSPSAIRQDEAGSWIIKGNTHGRI